MESRNIQSESNHQNLINELKNRLAQIQEQRKKLAEEKIELLKTVKEQRKKVDEQIKQFVAPYENKAEEQKKAFDDVMRKNTYLYDYLPRPLAAMQIGFSSKREEVVRELREIAKSSEDYLTKMEREKENFDKMYKDLAELEKKPDQIEMELINEENQILQKLFEAQANSVRFFHTSVSSSDKAEKNLSSESQGVECKQRMG